MRKLNGFIFISALIMACSVASAQMVIRIDGVPINDGVIDSISIDPVANELNINTTLNYNVNVESVGDSVAINSFSPSSGTVVAGQTVTFSWNTSNAVSCQASNGVDGWSDTTITPLGIGAATIITATVGTHLYTLTCDGSEVNDTVSLNATVTTTSADALSISSFIATPDSISAGDTTNLSWTTVNAESCTPTGGTTDWTSQTITLPNGSANVTIDNTGTYTFSLVCQGISGDQQTRSDVVTVDGIDPRASCDSVTLAGSVVNWSSFWYQVFPGPVYENVTNYLVSRTGYLAIEFNTANIIDDGKISALENASTPGIKTGAISTCPGDFDVPAECGYTWGLGGGLSWSTNGKLGTCQLDSNTTYYFNITFTDGVDTSTSTCGSSPCRINLQHYNF
jgi:plastocyanin